MFWQYQCSYLEMLVQKNIVCMMQENWQHECETNIILKTVSFMYHKGNMRSEYRAHKIDEKTVN